MKEKLKKIKKMPKKIRVAVGAALIASIVGICCLVATNVFAGLTVSESEFIASGGTSGLSGWKTTNGLALGQNTWAVNIYDASGIGYTNGTFSENMTLINSRVSGFPIDAGTNMSFDSTSWMKGFFAKEQAMQLWASLNSEWYEYDDNKVKVKSGVDEDYQYNLAPGAIDTIVIRVELATAYIYTNDPYYDNPSDGKRYYWAGSNTSSLEVINEKAKTCYGAKDAIDTWNEYLYKDGKKRSTWAYDKFRNHYDIKVSWSDDIKPSNDTPTNTPTPEPTTAPGKIKLTIKDDYYNESGNILQKSTTRLSRDEEAGKDCGQFTYLIASARAYKEGDAGVESCNTWEIDITGASLSKSGDMVQVKIPSGQTENVTVTFKYKVQGVPTPTPTPRATNTPTPTPYVAYYGNGATSGDTVYQTGTGTRNNEKFVSYANNGNGTYITPYGTEFLKAGYHFKGTWNMTKYTTSKGAWNATLRQYDLKVSSYQYNDEAPGKEYSISRMTGSEGPSYVFIAQWLPNDYILTFDYNMSYLNKVYGSGLTLDKGEYGRSLTGGESVRTYDDTDYAGRRYSDRTTGADQKKWTVRTAVGRMPGENNDPVRITKVIIGRLMKC